MTTTPPETEVDDEPTVHTVMMPQWVGYWLLSLILGLIAYVIFALFHTPRDVLFVALATVAARFFLLLMDGIAAGCYYLLAKMQTPRKK